jgi:hypothetical protein
MLVAFGARLGLMSRCRLKSLLDECESCHPLLRFSDNEDMADHNPFRKGTPPDEVFENPLFRMERAGRFIRIETRRTPEQQAALVKNVIENRHRLLERATECRTELKALIHRFTSLDILAHQIAQDIMRDPNQYRGMDSELRPHLIEYLALLELEDTEYQVRAIESPSPSDVAKTRELLQGIFEAFKWQIMTEHITEENQGALNVRQELRYHALMYHVFVRSPAYHHHWVEILTALFTSPRVAVWLEERNLRIDDVLKIGWAACCSTVSANACEPRGRKGTMRTMASRRVFHRPLASAAIAFI